MHVCNTWCDGEDHVDMSYTDVVDATCERCKEIIERESKEIEVTYVREVYEFSREEARRQMLELSIHDKIEGITFSYDPGEREIRAFRVTFRRRKWNS